MRILARPTRTQRRLALALHVKEMWRQDAVALATILRAVNDELRALDSGQAASSSRDFGRGVAFAVKQIRQAEHDAMAAYNERNPK